jgi:hypothetical protein
MPGHLKISRMAAIAAMLLLTGCTNGMFANPEYIAVIVSPRIISLPEGGTIVFNAFVTNNLSLPQWSLQAAADTPSAGTLTPVAGSADSILYTAPSTPPVYTSAAAGIVQGSVTLDATTTAPPQSTSPVTGDQMVFIITAPTVTVSLTPTTATVPLGTNLQFDGYELGGANYTVTWRVNGVTGGVALYNPDGSVNPLSAGTISSNGFYTAPAAKPLSGNAVTITLISQADPTRTASAAVTLQ